MHCGLWLEGGGGMEVKFCVINWKGLSRSDFIGLYIPPACWPEVSLSPLFYHQSITDHKYS